MYLEWTIKVFQKRQTVVPQLNMLLPTLYVTLFCFRLIKVIGIVSNILTSRSVSITGLTTLTPWVVTKSVMRLSE